MAAVRPSPSQLSAGRLPIKSADVKVTVERSSSSASFAPTDMYLKCFALVLMITNWISYVLLVRHTRTRLAPSQLYTSSTVVVLSEAVKLTASVGLLYASLGLDWRRTGRCVREDFFGKPTELLKMTVPSLLYAVQNNLDFVALSNLDAAVYQVTSQLKILTTVGFMVAMLGRRYSSRRWLAIVLLAVGVAVVQLDATWAPASGTTDDVSGVIATDGVSPLAHLEPQKPAQNYLKGLLAVLVCCCTAGFSGVYFEKMLKDGTQTPFWIRNLQMYASGVVIAGFGCLANDGATIVQRGFFYGYDTTVVVIVGLMSVGGISISLVMKYLDNLIKSFASAVSIILVAVLSVHLTAAPLGLLFVLGTAVVCAAVLLYNSVPE